VGTIVIAVIGSYADYYVEHDGMVEIGPGCSERMQARLDALPDGDPRKVDWFSERQATPLQPDPK
jgi:hypothetical protein